MKTKKIILIPLILAFVFSPTTILADVNYTINGIKYLLRNIRTNEEAEKYQEAKYYDVFIVVGYTSIPSNGKVSIPRTICPSDYGFGDQNSYPVKCIQYGAFADCADITSVSLPYGLVEIENGAFSNCSNLTSVTIPNSVRNVGYGAFSNCSSLTSAKLSDKLTELSPRTFYGCTSLTSITIPNTITSIGSGAFQNCSNLSKIQLPTKLTSIGGSAFYYCSSLTSVTIPSSVNSIGSCAFAGTPITTIMLPDGLTTIEERLFQNCTKLTSVFVPNSIVSIGKSAFEECQNLTNIDIPNTVTNIGEVAFENCKSLKSISLPQDIEIINLHTFEGCEDLEYIEFPDKLKKIDHCAFRGCNSLKYVYTNQVETIAGGAFAQCVGLKYLIMNWKLKVIGSEHQFAFTDCTNLASVTYLGAQYLPGFGQAFSGVECQNIPLYVGGQSVIEEYYQYYDNCTHGFSPVQVVEWANKISSTEIKIYPARNSAKIEWPEIPDARIYAMDIYADGDSTHSLVFDNRRQLLLNKLTSNIPNEDDVEVPMPTTATSGLQYSISNLLAGTEYTYVITAYDKENNIIFKTSDKFSTDEPVFTITFANWDGRILLKLTDVKKGTIPAYRSAQTPTRPEDDEYIYTFIGWTPEIVPATEDATYTAVYEATLKGDGIEDIHVDSGNPSKVLHDNHLYIFRGEQIYTIQGSKIR